ncbi:MAG: hypothetical protein ACR2HV_08325 [Acidimicrobiales bacterium]
MRNRALTGIAVLAVAVLVATLTAALVVAGRDGDSPGPEPGVNGERPVTVGLWGDIPYTAEETARVARTIADMNAANLDFSVFDGDIKGGGPCEDRVYTQAIERFSQLDAPAVYVPGDNEWTDCRNEGRDVGLERLDHLRRVMFASPDSFGRRTMPLEHQGPGPEGGSYPENTRWQMGGVVFVGVHVVGSNNNLANPAEYAERDAANREWLRDSFDLARRTDAAGVMVIVQADPFFELVTPADRALQGVEGLDSFVDALRTETMAFGRPVALVHGDSHRYRLDHPMLEPSGAPVPNLVRLETFGTPEVSWVKATVDRRDPQVFRFETRFVE